MVLFLFLVKQVIGGKVEELMGWEVLGSGFVRE